MAPQLEEYQSSVAFQQDGAPPHWGIKGGQFLNKRFPNPWIGCDGPISWPPRHPDITT